MQRAIVAISFGKLFHVEIYFILQLCNNIYVVAYFLFRSVQLIKPSILKTTTHYVFNQNGKMNWNDNKRMCVCANKKQSPKADEYYVGLFKRITKSTFEYLFKGSAPLCWMVLVFYWAVHIRDGGRLYVAPPPPYVLLMWCFRKIWYKTVVNIYNKHTHRMWS